MCRNDETGLWIARSRSAPEEQENFKRQIIERAQQARAQAFRDLAEVLLTLPQTLVGSNWRGLRGLGARVAGVAGRWRKAHALRRARWAAIRELHALDDRTLKDIGLGRSEIESAIRDPERVMARALVRQAVRTGCGGQPKGVAKPAPARINKNAA